MHRHEPETQCATAIVAILKKDFPNRYVEFVTADIAREESVIQSMIKAIGLVVKPRTKLSSVRDAVVDHVICELASRGSTHFILVLDEMQALDYKDYQHLQFLQNILSIRGLKLTTMAPFESIWLILVKVLLINRASGRQIVDLIKNPKIMDCRHFIWWTQGAIDQARLEATLGFQPGDLNNSFLNKIPRDQILFTENQIRHCPSCIKIGHHSSIFGLRKIQFCPWHGDKLFSCSKCYDLLDFFQRPSKNARGFPSDIGLLCEHVLPLAEKVFTPDFSDSIYYEIGCWCNEFMAWLAESNKLVGDDIFRWIDSKQSKNHLDGMLLKYLEVRTAIPATIITSLEFPVTRLSLEYPFEREGGTVESWWETRRGGRLYDMQCLGVSSISKMDQVSCIKSLRRYLWKTYVSKHRKCYRSFVDLTRHQRMNLQSGSCCIVSLAYACWLASIFKAKNFDAAIGKYQSAYKAFGGKNHCPSVSFKRKLNILLLGFYRLWGGMLIGAAESDEVIVNFHNVEDDPTLSLNFSHTYRKQPVATLFTGDEKYSSYFVSAHHLQDLTSLRCKCTATISAYIPEELVKDLVERFHPDPRAVLRFIDPAKSVRTKGCIYL